MLDISLYGAMALMLGLAYRLRGGGFFTLSGDSECRAVWGVALMLTFVALHPFYWPLASLIFVGGWIGETIPHAFAQNMGRRTESWYSVSLAKRWPGVLIPEPDQADYPGVPFAVKYVCDACAMVYVGALRAVLVLSPSIGYGLATHSPATLHHAALALAVRALWQPLAYTIGWLVPLTLPSLAARSTEWCEFLDGAGWAAAWWVL